MTYHKDDLVRYRLEKSDITFEEARSLVEHGFWNGAANRLYYSCFYSVIALLMKDGIPVSTHNGARTEFFRRYVKTGILDKHFSSVYTDLMSKRQESDYGDFLDFTEEDILPLFEEAEKFIKTIKELISAGD